MQKITPFLWFDNNAGEAIDFYISIFKNGKVVSSSPGPDGSIMMGTFEIGGQQFHVLNGGPMYKFTEAISMYVNCETQEEVDELWEKLSAGGEKSRCGWLKDKFGMSWQIIPSALPRLMSDPDPVKVGRVIQAMMQMSKIDISLLEQAHKGE